MPVLYCTATPTEPLLIFGSLILVFLIGIILGGARERGKNKFHD